MARLVMRSAFAALIGALLLITPAAVADPTAAADPAQSAPPISITGGPTAGGPVVRTPAEQAFYELRSHLVSDYAKVRAGTLDRADFARENDAFLAQYGGLTGGEIAVVDLAPLATSGTLSMSQYAQSTTTYCGPATAYEILKYLAVSSGPGGLSLFQSHLAGQCATGFLCTDTLGNTPWYYYSGYPHPMLSPLNTWKTHAWYAVSSRATNYTTWLVYDIDNYHPLAVAVRELANGSTPHLVGHPMNIQIDHWIAASGYQSAGASTYYADSVHGTTFWSWGANVPAFSWISSGSSGLSYMMNTVPYGYIG
jgi:hypothetical protein